MKRVHRWIILFLLVISAPYFHAVLAQAPAVAIHAGIGYWTPRLSQDETYYLTVEEWQSATKSLGVSMDFQPEHRLSFVPVVDVHVYRRGHLIKNRTFWDLDADMNLLYVRVSPGVRFSASKVIRLRLGLSAQVLAMASGSLAETEHLSSGDVVTDYSGRLREVMRPVSFGPDFQLLFRIPLGKIGAIEPGISTYISLNRMQKPRNELGYQPRIWQLGLQLGYVLPTKKGS